ncbi:galanin receptor 2b-like [Glandiceps talaboti]
MQSTPQVGRSNATVAPMSTDDNHMMLLQGTTLSIIMVLSAFLNFLACYVILKTTSLRSKPHFRLILNLSFSDIALAITCMPLSIMSVFTDGEVFKTSEAFCKINGFLSITFTYASVFGLTAVSLDRYFAINHPLRYRDLLTPSIMNVLLAIIWVFSLGAAAIPLYGWSEYSYNPGTHHCSPTWSSDNHCKYYTVCVVFGLVIPIVVMNTSYIFIYRQIKRSSARVNPGMVRMTNVNNISQNVQEEQPDVAIQDNSVVIDNGPIASHGDQGSSTVSQVENRRVLAGKYQNKQLKKINLRAEKKVAATGAILIIIYFLCWGMYAIVNSCYLHVEINVYIRVSAMWIAYSNSMLNPIIYTWTNRQVRNKVISMLKR